MRVKRRQLRPTARSAGCEGERAGQGDAEIGHAIAVDVGGHRGGAAGNAVMQLPGMVAEIGDAIGVTIVRAVAEIVVDETVGTGPARRCEAAGVRIVVPEGGA
jgi:hypothetical protein